MEMMIGIAAVVVVIILAIVLMMVKRRQSNTTSAPSLHRPKTLAEQQQELQEQRQQTSIAPNAAPAAPSVEQALSDAHRYLNQLDYAGAEHTLRQAIQHHPKNADLQLTLLNTFALAKDYAGFERYYPDVVKLQDATVLQKANSLKQLIDEERQSQAAKASPMLATPAAVVTASDVLEFDTLAPSQENAQSHARVVSSKPVDTDDAFDFDLDLDTSATAQPTTTSQSTVNTSSSNLDSVVSTVNDDNDFDFDLEMPTATVDTPVSHAPILDSAVANPVENTPSVDNALSASDDSLVLDTLDFDVSPSTTPAATSTPVQPDDTIDFGLDELNFDSLTTTTATQPTATPNSDAVIADSADTSIDLAFDDILSDIPAAQTPTPGEPTIQVEPAPKEESFVDADFDIDFSTLDAIQSTAQESAQATSAKSDTLADDQTIDISFDLALDPEEIPLVPTVTDETESVETVIADTDKPEARIPSPTDDTFAEFDELFVQTSAPVTEAGDYTNPNLTTAAPATNDATISFEQAFDLLKDVDSDQINLELAEQYLDLGEYDSAKRLLNEIQANNNSEYAARVEQLLEKIG